MNRNTAVYADLSVWIPPTTVITDFCTGTISTLYTGKKKKSQEICCCVYLNVAIIEESACYISHTETHHINV